MRKPNLCNLWIILAFAVASEPLAPAPVFTSDDPNAIYAADRNDSWNRIFRALFTRTVKHRTTDDYPEGAPFMQLHGLGIGITSLRISKEKFSRAELGDRAIEPLYPTFFTNEGPRQILSEPRYSEFTAALRQAIDESKQRSPVERALMQADVWAAYDIIYRMRRASPEIRADQSDPEGKLLILLKAFIRKLALTSDEIKSLKNNYLVAAGESKLPDLFSSESGWLEIELLSHRHHEDTAAYRRAARVFVKPRVRPSDPGQFVESLKHGAQHERVEAVALLVQNLLVDASGRVVPSPLFSDVQFRFFNGAVSGELKQFELSRRKLLTEPTSGGLVEFSASSPAYLSAAGNDYDFATPIQEAGGPVLAPLRNRCTQCHGPGLTTLMTYSIHYIPPVPTVRILSDQERALYVARRKEERDDFRSLGVIDSRPR